MVSKYQSEALFQGLELKTAKKVVLRKQTVITARSSKSKKSSTSWTMKLKVHRQKSGKSGIASNELHVTSTIAAMLKEE